MSYWYCHGRPFSVWDSVCAWVCVLGLSHPFKTGNPSEKTLLQESICHQSHLLLSLTRHHRHTVVWFKCHRFCLTAALSLRICALVQQSALQYGLNNQHKGHMHPSIRNSLYSSGKSMYSKCPVNWDWTWYVNVPVSKTLGQLCCLNVLLAINKHDSQQERFIHFS